MKKLFTLFILSIFIPTAFGQLGQIMNGGFENWSTITLYENPDQWRSWNTDEFRGIPLITKSTDAQSGSFSARLEVEQLGPDTIYPYLYLGGTGQSGPDQGIPYSSSCDRFNCYVKASLAPGDTAFVVSIKFNSGTAVAFDVVPLATGNISTWTSKTVNISPLPQDSLFIGVVIGDPFGSQTLHPNSYILIDNVSMGLSMGSAPAALPNPSFESWTAEGVEEADNWFSLNPYLSGLNIENTTKTTDAASGTYAVQLETIAINNNNDTLPGVISMGPVIIDAPGSPFVPAPYAAEPTTLTGEYKFAPNGTDEGFLSFEFYAAGIQVGGGFVPFITAQSAYTSFSVGTNLSATPDSVVFMALSGSKPGTILKLDNLSFSGGNVGITELLNQQLFSIYPKPATDQVFLLPSASIQGIANVEVIDVTGRIINSFTVLPGQQSSIDVSNYPSGSYFVQMTWNTERKIEKLIVR